MGSGASVASGDSVSKEEAKRISGAQWNEEQWEAAGGGDAISSEQWNKIVQAKTQRKKTVKDYRRLKRLGKGAYGVVDLVRRKDGELYVMKIVKEESIMTKNNHVQSSMNEAKILHDLKHPNIVGLEDFFVEGKYLLLILEYCDSSDLKVRIQKAAKKSRQFHETQVMDWFVQLAFALEYLHSQKLAHRDIKPQNVFLTRRNKIVKLGDLGVTRKLDSTLENMKTMVGTPYYMAPELAQGIGYNLANDVWALGCVLAETMLLQVPFPAKDFMSLVAKITKEKHVTISTVYSDDVRSLVDFMLNKDPAKRPSIKEVLDQPFVQHHITGFVERYNTSAAAASSSDTKESQKQEALKKQIAQTDNDLEAIKGQIMKATDASKRGELEAQLKRKREQLLKENLGLHQSVHISDEDTTMTKVAARAQKR